MSGGIGEQIVTGIFAVVMALLTGFVIPLLRTKVKGAKLDNEVHWGEVAVKAAEQKGTAVTGEGKKALAEELVKSKFPKIDPQTLDVVIEAGVHTMWHGKKQDHDA